MLDSIALVKRMFEVCVGQCDVIYHVCASFVCVVGGVRLVEGVVGVVGVVEVVG